MKAYRFFAYFIAVEVVIQAAVIAFGVFGQGKWITDDGGVLNKTLLEDRDADYPGVVGFAIHSINGSTLIPLLAIILLIISFFAKVPSGVKWAAIVLLLVVVQVTLGITAHSVPALGPLHAVNAFAILFVALHAGRRTSGVASATAAPAAG